MEAHGNKNKSRANATMCDNYDRKLCHKQHSNNNSSRPQRPAPRPLLVGPFWSGPPTWPQKKQATTTMPTTTQLSK